MNILGISAYYHDSAACLLQDGRLITAVEEERFTRRKHDHAFPLASIRHCLASGGIDVTQIDCVAYYEDPVKKLGRQLWAGPKRGSRTLAMDCHRPERAIREELGYEGTVRFFEHHRSHAASAFYCSGFDAAALLTVDGVGEWATTSYGAGHGAALELFEEVEFPDSLGLLYATLTTFLGFSANDGEYKVMGLAPYGRPRYLDRLTRLVHSEPGGQYRLDLDYFDFVNGARMYSDALSELVGLAPREPESPIDSAHEDLAASVQVLLERLLLEKVRYLHDRVSLPALCMAGGVALNIVANQTILREGPFRELFVQPAAGDAGGCLGAAALAHVQLTGARPAIGPLATLALGPAYPAATIRALLDAADIPYESFEGREAPLLEHVVDQLVTDKVVGWFQGRMEFGPRALGSRSILADPRVATMRETINARVKKREAFRPFAPAVLAEHAAEHFELDGPSPFMLRTCAVRSKLSLPAITHVDGSARPQTVAGDGGRFRALLAAFHARTGCPILLNTSFNVRGEPIVCTPQEAVMALVNAELDVLVLEDVVVHLARLGEDAREVLLLHWNTFVGARVDGATTMLYAFL